MTPPYDPDHVEAINFADSATYRVYAKCSCGWKGQRIPLGYAWTAQKLAAQLNLHRATYARRSPV